MAKTIVTKSNSLNGRAVQKTGETVISSAIVYLIMWLVEKYVFKSQFEEEVRAMIALVLGDLVRRFLEKGKIVVVPSKYESVANTAEKVKQAV